MNQKGDGAVGQAEGKRGGGAPLAKLCGNIHALGRESSSAFGALLCNLGVLLDSRAAFPSLPVPKRSHN